MQWNYYAAYIGWNSDEERWEAFDETGQPLAGRLSHVLQAFGRDEWDLVSITAERWIGPMAEMSRIIGYRAFFRKPLPVAGMPPTESA
jgi:hypothetical protein